ncbi:hypothetical protein TNCV_3041771 [Trichonephila clavipes]|nr:hypothetical protein TNCV_3041771 [Trichonephila clavipes]
MRAPCRGAQKFSFTPLITFTCSEKDITLRKRSKIVILHKHISMTVRDISTVVVSPSTIRKRLLKVSHKATRLRKKQFPIQKKVKKRLAVAKKYQSSTVNDYKVIFSDETNLSVQGCKLGIIRRIGDETLLPDHNQQTVKHLLN